MDRFEGMQTQVVGLSADSVPCLKAWADSLGGISFPLLSDFYPHGEVARKFGVLREEGFPERAIFVIDKIGIVRFAKIYPQDEQPDNDELFAVLQNLEPDLAKAVDFGGKRAPGQEVDYQLPGEVVMFCTPWCPACRRARAYFRERGVSYEEVNISRDRTAADQVRKWANGNETTPTFYVRGQVMVEFSEEKLDQALGFK